MCRILEVTRQGYYKYLKSLSRPYKHAVLLATIKAILKEDEFNSEYGRKRLKLALSMKGFEKSESTIYRVCKENNILVAKGKPRGLTKADKEAYKNDDLLKGDFKADKPNKKLIGDITQLPTSDGTLYISTVFDCFDNACLGLSMADNMKSELVEKSLKGAISNIKTNTNSSIIFHSDRGSQYTSGAFRNLLNKNKIIQSMSYAKSSCYGNAKCESLFARFKVEAIYNRYKTEQMSMDAVKNLVFRYFMSYWNNRRIFTSNEGLPPYERRKRFFNKKEQSTIAQNNHQVA